MFQIQILLLADSPFLINPRHINSKQKSPTITFILIITLTLSSLAKDPEPNLTFKSTSQSSQRDEALQRWHVRKLKSQAGESVQPNDFSNFISRNFWMKGRYFSLFLLLFICLSFYTFFKREMLSLSFSTSFSFISRIRLINSLVFFFLSQNIIEVTKLPDCVLFFFIIVLVTFVVIIIFLVQAIV